MKLSTPFVAALCSGSAIATLNQGNPQGGLSFDGGNSKPTTETTHNSSMRSVAAKKPKTYMIAKAICNCPDMETTIPVSKIICSRIRRKMNMTSYNEAAENLKRYGDRFNVPPRSIYASVGRDRNATAYVCSGLATNPIRRDEWDEAERLLDWECGEERGGIVNIDKYKKMYGRAVLGEVLCPQLWIDDADRFVIEPHNVTVKSDSPKKESTS